MSSILQNGCVFDRNAPIFVENLESWAVAQLEKNHPSSRIGDVLGSLLQRADDSGVALATYRLISRDVDIAQPVLCKHLVRLERQGFIKKLHGKPPEMGRFRLLCLKGGE